MGTCPHCEKQIGTVTIFPVTAFSGMDSYKAVVYCCPLCGSVLSAGIDPLALKADTVSDVIDELRQG